MMLPRAAQAVLTALMISTLSACVVVASPNDAPPADNGDAGRVPATATATTDTDPTVPTNVEPPLALPVEQGKLRRLRSAANGLTVDLAGAITTSASRVLEYANNNAADNQLWYIAGTNTSGVFALRTAVDPNKCMQIDAVGRLQVADCSGKGVQQWVVQVVSNGNITLTNNLDKRCLAVTDTANTQLSTRPCDRTAYQTFTVSPSSPNPTNYGEVSFQTARGGIIGVSFDLIVPPKPKDQGVVQTAIGVSPNSNDTNPVGIGLFDTLKLSWGNTCIGANSTRPQDYSSWWINSAYLQNLNTDTPSCVPGDGFAVDANDTIHVQASILNQVWVVNIKDQQSGKSMTFKKDLQLQVQQSWVADFIPATNAKPISDLVLRNIALTLDRPDGLGCRPFYQGINDFVATPTFNTSGNVCNIPQITLRVQGVPATTQDPPLGAPL